MLRLQLHRGESDNNQQLKGSLRKIFSFEKLAPYWHAFIVLPGMSYMAKIFSTLQTYSSVSFR